MNGMELVAELWHLKQLVQLVLLELFMQIIKVIEVVYSLEEHGLGLMEEKLSVG
jgi:hypothetical protein